VQPLVDEANALIAARSQDLVDARARAGDLAHAIKTPLAVIDVHVRKLRSEGQADIANPIAVELGHVDRGIRRELARARANIHATNLKRRVNVFPVLERTCGALAKLTRGHDLRFEIDCDRSMQVLVDDTDLLEFMGNLVENATKWASSTVWVAGRRGEDGSLSLTVTDDGPGLSPQDIVAVQARGVRLDQAVHGTGLGLGIVRDICALYGGELILGRSEVNGLSASVVIPASRVV
jgi:signal transduction histidine kinase